MRTNIFVIGVEVPVVESYGGGKRVKCSSDLSFQKRFSQSLNIMPFPTNNTRT